MRYFFIDLENVKSEGLEGVLSLGNEDNVIIFYSENAMNLTIPALENLNNSKASKKFIKTNYIGKNAMDFQIVSLFGAMIERNKQGSYYIISQDNGFRSAVSFCESYFENYHPICGVHPTIIAAITDEMKKAAAKAKPAPAAKTAKNVKEAVPEQNSQAAQSAQTAQTAQGTQTAQNEQTSQDTASQPKKKRHRKKKSPSAEAQKNSSESEDVESEAPCEEDATPEDTGSTADNETAPTEAVVQAPAVNRLEYIYNTLGELLSAKTIDIYASAIDEGIARCANREELHEFFRGRYGDDEGEALYKVMQSDFEAMKQARPKKTSGTHRRGHRKSKKSKAPAAE